MANVHISSNQVYHTEHIEVDYHAVGERLLQIKLEYVIKRQNTNPFFFSFLCFFYKGLNCGQHNFLLHKSITNKTHQRNQDICKFPKIKILISFSLHKKKVKQWMKKLEDKIIYSMYFKHIQTQFQFQSCINHFETNYL